MRVQAYPKSIFKPSVSIIVPAYNCERLIPQCLVSLFKNAVHYMGFCEIIVVDDGSSDYTYEMAWATIQKCRRRWPHVGGKVVRHSTKLGIKQAIKTGVNKALGTLIFIVGSQSILKPNALKEIVETFERKNKTTSNSRAVLCKAETLRKLFT
ncbi:MAG: glycosyltransferase family 2 protein [Candidatus Bathyarchaeia archaeon]|nr:glycosyltransferase family 2 protein [Candidatus Bathyarchaeota archaeon]